MVSLARRLRERLFWPSERSMQKLMGRIDSLENEIWHAENQRGFLQEPQ